MQSKQVKRLIKKISLCYTTYFYKKWEKKIILGKNFLYNFFTH